MLFDQLNCVIYSKHNQLKWKKETFQMCSDAILTHNSPKLAISESAGINDDRDTYMQMELKGKFTLYIQANTVLY